MTVKNALSKGFDLVSRHIKMIPLIYAVNFTLTLLLAIPFLINLYDKIGDRVIRDDMLHGFDSSWWMHFDPRHILASFRPGLLNGIIPLFDNVEMVLTGQFNFYGFWMLLFGLVWLLLSSFLNGGVLGLFTDEKRSFSVSRFFSNAGFYFHHFFALLLTALIVFFLFYKFVQPLLLILFDQFTTNWSSDTLRLLLHSIAFSIVLFLVYFINMIFDYAKIIIVVEKKDSSWMSIWLGIKFVFAHFGRAMGLYLLIAAIAALGTLIFGLILSFSKDQFFLVLIAVILQQLFMLVKIGIRLLFYGSQLSLYSGLHAPERKMKRL
ncbi:hypothetical protein GF407_11450 [candidate division KSB1 bacterium]|nr:hypothetical protein [candidate division KSB1 bacterium]